MLSGLLGVDVHGTVDLRGGEDLSGGNVLGGLGPTELHGATNVTGTLLAELVVLPTGVTNDDFVFDGGAGGGGAAGMGGRILAGTSVSVPALPTANVGLLVAGTLLVGWLLLRSRRA